MKNSHNLSVVLLIVGLVIVTSPLLLLQNTLTDATKGFLYGAGIGFLVLSLLARLKTNKLIG